MKKSKSAPAAPDRDRLEDAPHAMVFKTHPSAPELRLTAAVNHFKHQLLGQEHVPNLPQTSLVMARLPRGLGIREIGSRTWTRWFSNPLPRPRPSTIDCLDLWAVKIGFDQISEFRDQGHMYRELATQGLAHALLRPTSSRNPEMTARVRAAEYVPATALHLHLDALEIAGLIDNNGVVQRETLQMIGAERLMQLLHERWNIRSGRVYQTLSSDLALHLSQVGDEEVAEIKRALDRFKPSLHDSLLKKAPSPIFFGFADQRDLGPTRVHQTLLAIAGDDHFLQADRLEAWCLDLASSCLALHALTWAQQTAGNIGRIESEVVYLAALEALLFVELDESELGQLIGQINVVGRFEWTADVFDTLVRAREHYHWVLRTYGLKASDVWAGAKRNELLTLL